MRTQVPNYYHNMSETTLPTTEVIPIQPTLVEDAPKFDPGSTAIVCETLI